MNGFNAVRRLFINLLVPLQCPSKVITPPMESSDQLNISFPAVRNFMEDRIATIELNRRLIAELHYSFCDRPLWFGSIGKNLLFCIYDDDVQYLTFVFDLNADHSPHEINFCRRTIFRSLACHVRKPSHNELQTVSNSILKASLKELKRGLAPQLLPVTNFTRKQLIRLILK